MGIAIKLWPFHKGLKPQFEHETESLKEKKELKNKKPFFLALT